MRAIERLDIRTRPVRKPRDSQRDDGERLPVTPLGQSGYRFGFGDCVVYVDPYLSDFVERLEGEDHRRLTPAPTAAGAVTDARVCCITHIHQDHADPDTLMPLARASAPCRFVCPNEVAKALWAWEIDRDRVVIADREPMRLSDALAVTPVPAAHEDLDIDEEGRGRYLGYVFEWPFGRRVHGRRETPSQTLCRRPGARRPIYKHLFRMDFIGSSAAIAGTHGGATFPKYWDLPR